MYFGIIKNTEFEGGQQNMMGFLCMKAVYEHTPYLHGREKYYYVPDIQVHHPLHKKVSNPAREICD